MKKDKNIRLYYLLADWIGITAGWTLFNYLRYTLLDLSIIYKSFLGFLSVGTAFIGMFIVPLVGIMIYYFSGYYNHILRKSRTTEFVTTLSSNIVIVLGIFIFILLDDLVKHPDIVYTLLTALMVCLCLLVYLPRIILTTHYNRLIHQRKITFRTLVVGTGEKAKNMIRRLNAMPLSLGYEIIDTVPSTTDIESIIRNQQIEEIILAEEGNEEQQLQTLYKLYGFELPIHLLGTTSGLLTGRSSTNVIYSSVNLICLTQSNFSDWELNLKRAIDIVLSAIGILILLPLLLYIAVGVRIDSPGSIFYKQVRVGRRGRLFNIYKFRSMVATAEDSTPLLSSINDPRITRFGLMLRKYRLDELPQLINIIKGEMSLVGPRPERPYFIEQIVRKAPYYGIIQKMTPGLTSWGMVKYGYASSVEEMIERLEYDLFYVESCSLLIDLKILFYTLKVVATGRGI